MSDNKVTLTDKDLHCIARLLQSECMDESVQCLYCKYALQCAKKIIKDYPFDESLKKLVGITGVNIHMLFRDKMRKDILEGSWIEKYPKLFKKLSDMPLTEQIKILQNLDILEYKE